MQDNTSFLELDNEGVVHNLVSDGYHIHMVYEDVEDDRLYLLTLDKSYVIITATEVETPAAVSSISFIKWHRHTLDAQGLIIMSGCLTVAREDYKFQLDNKKLTVCEKVVFNNGFSLQTLNSLKGIQVDAHVQKGNYLYVAGWDVKTECSVFIETHIGRDKAVRRYTLGSDVGNITIYTICIDSSCDRIYLGGVSIHENKLTPYLEAFFYNKLS